MCGGASSSEPSMKSLNIKTRLALLAAGLCVTINSDDPAYFGGYLNDNLVQLFESLPQMGAREAYQVLRNSFEGSFVDDEDKALWIEELDSVFAAQ